MVSFSHPTTVARTLRSSGAVYDVYTICILWCSSSWAWEAREPCPGSGWRLEKVGKGLGKGDKNGPNLASATWRIHGRVCGVSVLSRQSAAALPVKIVSPVEKRSHDPAGPGTVATVGARLSVGSAGERVRHAPRRYSSRRHRKGSR